MALKISYGNGSLGNVSEVTSTINSYAKVTAVNSTSITIDTANKLDGGVGFSVGEKILLHVSASVSGDKVFLGNYLLANITAVNGDILTLDEDPTACITSDNLAKYYVQAISVAQYQNLTLGEGTTITPPIYSTMNYYGGIVALMCSDTLTFDGGHISLADKGIPPASKSLRPETHNDVASDTETYSGWENSDTRIHFMLNSGDGAAFIVAKKMICHEDSRIGNVATYGCQFFRGASNSVTYDETKPENVTNVGGSTIFIAAETIENFGHKMLAKYRASGSTKGQGICRCYIASETKLRNDEGLYAYDCISNPARISKMNIKNFGNGSFGDGTDITTQLNNYATITAVDGMKISYKSKTTTGLAQITSGALVMIHFNHKDSNNVTDAGRFILANVLADNGTTLTLDAMPPAISPDNYAAQIVSIPQFNNFTLAKENSATATFDGAQGGICAIAVKNNCDLSGGKITLRSMGGGGAYGREGLAVIGNAQDSDKLPIGQGDGSVFILAKNLTFNTTSRLTKIQSGYNSMSYRENGGSGAGPYVSASGANSAGYGSNATKLNPPGSNQGGHIMIVADTITGFSLNPIGTGGGYVQSAGTGGYGGYNGGGYSTSAQVHGGSSGWAFIYCNNVVDQDTDRIIRAN